MAVVRILPDTPPLPPYVASATGTLWLVGQGFRSGSTGPTLSTTPPGVIINMTVVNATHLRLTCNATVWYWSTALLTVAQLGYNASIAKPAFANLLLVTMAPGTIPYGAPLQLAAPLLGAATPTRITLQLPAPAAPFNCSFVRAINVNVTECTPWMVHDAALGVPLTLSLLLSIGVSTITLPPSLAVTITRPTLTLYRNGAAVVLVTARCGRRQGCSRRPPVPLEAEHGSALVYATTTVPGRTRCRLWLVALRQLSRRTSASRSCVWHCRRVHQVPHT